MSMCSKPENGSHWWFISFSTTWSSINVQIFTPSGMLTCWWQRFSGVGISICNASVCGDIVPVWVLRRCCGRGWSRCTRWRTGWSSSGFADLAGRCRGRKPGPWWPCHRLSRTRSSYRPDAFPSRMNHARWLSVACRDTMQGNTNRSMEMQRNTNIWWMPMERITFLCVTVWI